MVVSARRGPALVLEDRDMRVAEFIVACATIYASVTGYVITSVALCTVLVGFALRRISRLGEG
jgi:hypothetical protein